MPRRHADATSHMLRATKRSAPRCHVTRAISRDTFTREHARLRVYDSASAMLLPFAAANMTALCCYYDYHAAAITPAAAMPPCLQRDGCCCCATLLR